MYESPNRNREGFSLILLTWAKFDNLLFLCSLTFFQDLFNINIITILFFNTDIF